MTFAKIFRTCLVMSSFLLAAGLEAKSALITGITGQDGSYLAEFLLEKGYTVHGIVRRASAGNFQRIKHLSDDEKLRYRFFLHDGDLGESSSLYRILEQVKPDEIYNLAAMSHVKISFEMPEYTADVDAVGVFRLLDAARKICPNVKFYQASTSELFGKVHETPQTEQTPFHPRSPYGVSKLCGYWAVVNYREAYGMFACNGILFNHESPRRGDMFVSRKITVAVARIKNGLQNRLILGNLDAKRDWGYAKDYVEGMWLILQKNRPEDYVLGTGRTSSVRQFVELAFKEIGIDIVWQGEGVDEKGVDSKTGRVLVECSPEYYRPAEVDYLISDNTKAERELGWSPKTSLEELVKIMVQSDLKELEGS